MMEAIPTFEELRQLSPRAILANAIRTARRVQPYLIFPDSVKYKLKNTLYADRILFCSEEYLKKPIRIYNELANNPKEREFYSTNSSFFELVSVSHMNSSTFNEIMATELDSISPNKFYNLDVYTLSALSAQSILTVDMIIMKVKVYEETTNPETHPIVGSKIGMSEDAISLSAFAMLICDMTDSLVNDYKHLRNLAIDNAPDTYFDATEQGPLGALWHPSPPDWWDENTAIMKGTLNRAWQTELAD